MNPHNRNGQWWPKLYTPPGTNYIPHLVQCWSYSPYAGIVVQYVQNVHWGILVRKCGNIHISKSSSLHAKRVSVRETYEVEWRKSVELTHKLWTYTPQIFTTLKNDNDDTKSTTQWWTMEHKSKFYNTDLLFRFHFSFYFCFYHGTFKEEKNCMKEGGDY